MATRLTDKYLQGFISEHEYQGVAEEVKAAHKALHDGTCLGNDFIGWLNLPVDYDKEDHQRDEHTNSGNDRLHSSLFPESLKAKSPEREIKPLFRERI